MTASNSSSESLERRGAARAGLPRGETRIGYAAHLQPARLVGGDLFDFCRLDAHRLYAMIGDVSGKGPAVAAFAGQARRACRRAALRRPLELDRALAEAEAELSRHNGQALFVTVLAVVLDLRTGEMSWCNAGHEPPYALGADGVRRIDHAGRPPLCVGEGYPFPLGYDRLQPGEQLCLLTDGVTEAASADGELYGRQRLERCLRGVADADPAEVLAGLRAELSAFAEGADPADDLTIVILRWSGPADDVRRRRFAARAEALPEVRAFVEDAGGALGADAAAVLRIALVAEELFLNCVLHGYRGAVGEFDLQLDALDDELRLVAEDAAPAFDPFADPPSADPAGRRVGGLGRVLVAGLATRHRYERREGRNRVTVHMLRTASG